MAKPSVGLETTIFKNVWRKNEYENTKLLFYLLIVSLYRYFFFYIILVEYSMIQLVAVQHACTFPCFFGALAVNEQ